STLIALSITTFLILVNLPNLLSAHAQDVETQAAAGELDTSFGNGGKVTMNLAGRSIYCDALTIQADGKIIAAGNTSEPDDFLLARLNSDGSIDTSFGSDGKVITDFSVSSDTAYAVALQADGQIVVAGASFKGTGISQNFALAR